MAEPSDQGNYVVLTDAKLWWREDGNRMHLIINDPDLQHPDTEPGMQIVFSDNPESADYNPANFNRCARVLRHHGKPAPDMDAVEGPRQLDRR